MNAARRPLSRLRRRCIAVQTHWYTFAADRLAAELPAVLAHELRTPLTCALMASDLVVSAESDGATKEQAARLIRRHLWHMSHLIDDVLDVTKIVLGKITLHCRRLDLAAWARASAADLR